MRKIEIMEDKLDILFKETFNDTVVSRVRLVPAGSGRKYYRISGRTHVAIGVESSLVDENRAFFAIDGQLRSKGLPVPKIIAVSDDQRHYILQDLGDTSLFDIIKNDCKSGYFRKETMELLIKVIALLPDIQYSCVENFDFSLCYPSPFFNRRTVFWDLNYFKYSFLKTSGLEFNEELLENDFESLASVLLSEPENNSITFMYRDFQSRNVMVLEGQPWFIDFQGGRRGPVEYDLASFLWQARTSYPDRIKNLLIDEYLDSLKKYRQVDADFFRTRLARFAVFRLIQVLGAYGFRGFFERKQQFISKVPQALAMLNKLLSEQVTEFSYLSGLIVQLLECPSFMPLQRSDEGGLTVRVGSFSYRKGIPIDPTGHGGGFVFDCRILENPGLFEEYKQLNGTDAPVISFFREKGETDKFLHSVYGLVVPAIEKYLSRGLSSLMVSFGCTGGQHRSVYCAELLVGYLRDVFNDRIDVKLSHRELEEMKNNL